MPRFTQQTLVIGLLIAAASNGLIFAEDGLRFGRDILPILSTSCYACHGPDQAARQANLRFDIEADAKAEHDGGTPIVPGKPDDSSLMQRIVSTDPEVMMPPPDSHKDLEPAQIQTLTRWIAVFARTLRFRHWSH